MFAQCYLKSWTIVMPRTKMFADIYTQINPDSGLKRFWSLQQGKVASLQRIAPFIYFSKVLLKTFLNSSKKGFPLENLDDESWLGAKVLSTLCTTFKWWLPILFPCHCHNTCHLMIIVIVNIFYYYCYC